MSGKPSFAEIEYTDSSDENDVEGSWRQSRPSSRRSSLSRRFGRRELQQRKRSRNNSGATLATTGHAPPRPHPPAQVQAASVVVKPPAAAPSEAQPQPPSVLVSGESTIGDLIRDNHGESAGSMGSPNPRSPSGAARRDVERRRNLVSTYL